MDNCGRCNAELTEDNWQASFRKRRYMICSTCEKARQRAYCKANPQVMWNRNFKQKYNMAWEQYQELLRQQDGKCAICGSADSGRRRTGQGLDSLFVDHCHTTGKVRGLLCHGCNTGLGHFKDNIKTLSIAMEYLCTRST